VDTGSDRTYDTVVGATNVLVLALAASSLLDAAAAMVAVAVVTAGEWGVGITGIVEVRHIDACIDDGNVILPLGAELVDESATLSITVAGASYLSP
jgi:hypothetical protein